MRGSSAAGTSPAWCACCYHTRFTYVAAVVVVGLVVTSDFRFSISGRSPNTAGKGSTGQQALTAVRGGRPQYSHRQSADQHGAGIHKDTSVDALYGGDGGWAKSSAVTDEKRVASSAASGDFPQGTRFGDESGEKGVGRLSSEGGQGKRDGGIAEAAAPRAQVEGDDATTGGGVDPHGHTVMTVATQRDLNLCRYLHSALWNGFLPTVLAHGQPYGHNTDKMIYLLEELRGYPPDHLIIFSDADVIFQASDVSMRRTYDDYFRQKFVVSANCVCHPFNKHGQPWMCDKFLKAPGRAQQRFINSGSMMGRAADFVRLAELVLEYPRKQLCWPRSDQERIQRIFVEGESHLPMQIDYFNRFAMAMNEASAGSEHERSCEGASAMDLDSERGQLINRHTQGAPATLHYAGPMKRLLDPTYKQLRKAWTQKLGSQAAREKEVRVQATVLRLGNETMTFGEACGEYLHELTTVEDERRMRKGDRRKGKKGAR